MVERAPVPTPVAGEVLLEVHAAAITFDELTWTETWARDGVDRTPIIPSHEVSGVVAALGDGVAGLAPGDEVYGLIRFDRDGAAAEYATVPAADLAARPATVSHVVAAALPLAGLTALQALVDHAGALPSEKVLVLGGAGGVGALTVQLGHLLGADVTATVRSDVADLVRQRGATRVIDTRIEAFDESDDRYDVVIDTVGGDDPARAFSVLRRGGRLIALTAPPPQGMADEFGVTADFFIVTPDHDQLARLAGLVDSGALDVTIADVFPLDQGRKAFESGRAPNRRAGKTVLAVRD